MTFVCRFKTCFFIFAGVTLFGSGLAAQAHRGGAEGVGWRIRGIWHLYSVEGPQISTGVAIPPGALLQPGSDQGEHSITLLLPDGQRVLYECYHAEDCAHGFRVPSLYRAPEPFATDMLARINAVLLGRSTSSESEQSLSHEEAVGPVGPGNTIKVAGLVATLPNGHYTYDLRPVDSSLPGKSGLSFDKTSSSPTLVIPGPGLYRAIIFDHLHNPRINLFVAAFTGTQAPKLEAEYHQAQALLKDWNGDYQGWPVHEFQRAYLQALLQGIAPATRHNYSGSLDATKRSDAAAEPAFTPRPGLFQGDVSVTIACQTPSAVIHYTMDGSQPLANSAVYRAPIMVKGTGLTVKAFATAPGKKDSAVITGIFRVADE